ncbi:MAG: hypothetical protein NC120_13885 [Ruminococcus sp.]|nr:hypothetical protein [Ruminococcus sp.]
MDTRKKALADLTAAVSPAKNEKRDIAALSAGDLFAAINAEPNGKKRRKMLEIYIARRKEAADFLSENESLINAEAEAALIGAAVGGTVEERRVSYRGGRKCETVVTKQLPPNMTALSMLLKNRMPDRYSDKPMAEIEIEDVSGVDEMIANAAENKDKENNTV